MAELQASPDHPTILVGEGKTRRAAAEDAKMLGQFLGLQPVAQIEVARTPVGDWSATFTVTE